MIFYLIFFIEFFSKRWPIVVAAVVCLCCVAALVAFMSFRNRDKQHDTFEDDGNNLAVVDSFLNSQTRQDFTYSNSFFNQRFIL